MLACTSNRCTPPCQNAGADKEITALAAATLRNLARNHDVNRTAIREAGAVAPLVWLLDAGKDKAHFLLLSTWRFPRL